MPKIINMIGQKYSKLTVIELSEKRGLSNQKMYKCICDCGNTHFTSGESIRSGKSKSCGCLRKLPPPNKNENRIEQIWKGLYKNTIEKRSLNKGWHKYIDMKKFIEISMQKCNYCGIANSNKAYDRTKLKTKREISTNFILFNGIDRVDSSKGYVEDNVVSCCKYCNTAKNTMSRDEFLKWIKRVYEYNY